MKCDELKRYEIDTDYPNDIVSGSYYDADEVDDAIAEFKAALKAQIAELEKERRWRKFSDEKPKEKQWILVYYGYENNGCRINLRRWDYGCQYDVEFQGIYTHWMPIPYAPKDEFKSNNEVNNA